MDGKSSLSPRGDLLEMPLGLISPGDIPAVLKGNTSQAAAGTRRTGKILFPWPPVLPVGFQLPVLEAEAVSGLDVICVHRAGKQHQPWASSLLLSALLWVFEQTL